jgi:galactokinase
MDPVLAPDRLRDRLASLVPEVAGRADEAVVVRAPGRVNLIGEHTDYNDGLVLPAAVDLEVRIAFVPTDDRRVELVRAGGDGRSERHGFDLDAVGERRGSWIDYPAGVAWALTEAGLPLRGLRGVIASSLPAGSGLSSSAAIELASAWAMLADPAAVDPVRLAQLAQRAENRYVGVNCGLMDQFASACGTAEGAVLLDCRSLEHRRVRLRLETVTLAILDTGSPRRLEASEYNVRRGQCETAVAILAADDPAIRSLRDVTPAMLPAAEARLDPVVHRRVRHVVTENERVLATVDALEAGDLAAVGALFAASHASLRDDYEVSSDALDAMVEVALEVPGVVAARMTGAGFGGSVVALVRPDATGPLRDAVSERYAARTGLRPTVRLVRPADGAGAAD